MQRPNPEGFSRTRAGRASAAAAIGPKSLATLLAAVLATSAASAAHAQGVSFGAPGRVPREHDTDIGSKTTGDPALDYVLHCQGCHQAGGVGLEGAVPQLKDSVAAIAVLPGGREYLTRVPGVAQSQLDDQAVAALLNWLLAYFDPAHLPPDFAPFTAAEIAASRGRPLVNASEVRASVVAARPLPR